MAEIMWNCHCTKCAASSEPLRLYRDDAVKLRYGGTPREFKAIRTQEHIRCLEKAVTEEQWKAVLQ